MKKEKPLVKYEVKFLGAEIKTYVLSNTEFNAVDVAKDMIAMLNADNNTTINVTVSPAIHVRKAV